jgi:hypothetical protein
MTVSTDQFDSASRARCWQAMWQPTAEGTGSLVALEARHLPDHDAKDLLQQIAGVGRLESMMAQPATDQRLVKVDEALPTGGIGSQPPALEKARRALRQGVIT